MFEMSLFKFIGSHCIQPRTVNRRADKAGDTSLDFDTPKEKFFSYKY